VKRKKHAEENESSERWLLTYSDLITLLLAFFIMMYTFSKQDANKYKEVSAHLKAIFTGGTGIVYQGSNTDIDVISDKIVSEDEIKKQIEHEIQEVANISGLEGNFSVFSDERGITIRIVDKAFFDQGKADLKKNAEMMLEKIIPVINSIKNHVRIEGHTDDTPIKTNEFKSNWELSVKRATEVVSYLIEKGDIPPRRISAAGYAEYRPIVKNDTDANKSMNRRIEIIVTKGQNEQNF